MKSEQDQKVNPIPKNFHGNPILLFVFMIFFIIHFLLDMFVDLSRHAKPHVYCLHMLIIFAQALMDDLNSRENWNIQDWMYYAQHTDKSAESRLTIVALIFLNLDVISNQGETFLYIGFLILGRFKNKNTRNMVL